MANKSNKANWALTAVTAGYLASYPFNTSFAGGLVASTCGAAMVGGIADWFAVTALFRRPLGISYRTAIIARNREKILQIISGMVEQELLTPDNIKKTLADYDVPALLLQYLSDHGGAEDAKAFLEETGIQFARSIDGQELGRTIELILCKEVEQYELAPILATALEWSIQSGYGDRIINFLLNELIRLISTDQVLELLVQVAVEVQTTYERGMTRRRLFNYLVGQVLELTPQRAGQVVQQQAISLLEKLQEPGHPLRIRLLTWLVELAASLRTDKDIRQTIETWKHNWLIRDHLLRSQLTDFFRSVIHPANGEAFEQNLSVTIDYQVDRWIEDFAHNQMLKQQVDAWVKNALTCWLDTRCSELGILVRQKLDDLSSEDLSNFVESKAGDDLQMIRINGSLVGGLLGGIIYLGTYWLL